MSEPYSHDLTESDLRRYWAKVDRGAPDDCWEWTSARVPAGYGRLSLGGRGKSPQVSSRLAYLLEYGPFPKDLLVLHHCDNPPCCNPSHLFLGTHDDNVRDKIEKGRAAWGVNRGAKNGSAKLDRSTVRQIRQASGTVREIAASFDISKSQVSYIRRGESWAEAA